MSGISLDKFQNIQTNEKVTLTDDENKVTGKERGNLFGKVGSWLSRTEAKKTANNEVTKAFFESLEKTYGKEVGDYAIEGYEGRLIEGKPLSGYRIQQILVRAQEGQGQLTPEEALSVKTRLFTQQAPGFLSEALKNFGIAEDKREGWARELAKMLPEAPELSRQDLDPLNYGDEFRALLDNFVETNKGLFDGIGKLEAKRQDLYGHDGFDWKSAPQKTVEQYAFSEGRGTESNYRQKFLGRFGEGDGKTNDVDMYFRETVLPDVKKKFINSFGETLPEKMLSYDEARQQDTTVNNGTYMLYGASGTFVSMQRMESGVRMLQDEELRGEKFHVSVPPEDMARVFEALTPLLTEEDCPFPTWKVVDVDYVQRKLDDRLVQQDTLQKAKEDDPEAFTQEQQDKLDTLNGEIKDLLRLQNSCQVTLYLNPVHDVGDERVGELLRTIESTLTELGVEPVGTPESDETVGLFVSFRNGSQTYMPGDDGYDEVYDRIGESEGRSHGEPITERFDPSDKDYEQHKVQFRDNPHYLAQVGVIVSVHQQEVSWLSKKLAGIGDDRDGFATVVGEMVRLNEKIGALNIPQEAKSEIEDAYRLLKVQLDQDIGRQVGMSDTSRELVSDRPVDDHIQGFIDWVRTAPFDDVAKAEVEVILTLAGQIMARSGDPELPMSDRLRMTGELDSLQLELSRILTGQMPNTDGTGQQLIYDLRELGFDMDTSRLVSTFKDGANRCRETSPASSARR